MEGPPSATTGGASTRSGHLGEMIREKWDEMSTAVVGR